MSKIRRVLTGIMVLTFCSLLIPLSFAQSEKAKAPQKAFIKGTSYSAEALPDGKLKAKLQTLPPEAKEKAMQWLQSFSFSALDAAKLLRVDNAGGIYYVCPDQHGNYDASAPKQAAGTSPATGAIPVADASTVVQEKSGPTAARAPIPSSTPPAYHSKTGAPYVIYIDVNGATVSGTAWNTSEGVATWNCAPWSTDGDTTTFSDSEQTGIRQIWERLAEDYAPFNVDVTTDIAFDPATYGGDKDKVGWILICKTVDINNKQCPHYGAGGIAYVGVFGEATYSPNYQPAWVTPMGVANTAEAASHEMGHNMGLSHDGTSALEYYGGHGAGDISWGPIMGTGYGRNVSQWSKGEYYDANRSQDDLVIVTARVPYRTDDHGGSHATATVITPAGNGTFSKTGIISTTGEKDVFSFATGAGAITINATPFVCAAETKGGNLDIVLQLFDSTSTLVASNNPATATTAGISTTVSAGTYFVHVSPTGAGTPMSASPSGYTVYGSLGQYTLSGSVVLPGISIAESGGATEVTEGGATDSYSLVLGTPPAANVVVTVTPDSQVTVDTPSVTFTPANWSTPQSVTVTAVNDSFNEGPHIGTISHSSSSSDPAFNGIGVAAVSAIITDNDSVTVTKPNGGEKWIAGTTRTIEWASLMGGNVKIDLLKSGAPYSTIVSNTANDGSHAWSIPAGQASGTDYKIRITSIETPGTSDSSDQNFTIISPIYYAGMSSNPAWTLDTGWAYGPPTGGEQDGYGGPDPTSGYDGPNVIGYNLAGDYGANLANTRWAKTPAIDCTNFRNVKLSFQRWLGVEGFYDNAYIEVSNNGSTWTRVWRNSTTAGSDDDDGAWVYCEYNISGVADGKSTVYVRWGLGTTDSSWQWCGWNLDEVMLEGDSTLPADGVTITESGGSTDVAEGGASDTYTLVLMSAPSNNVTVNITPDSQVTVSTSSVTFTTGNWSSPQTVTVTAVDDALHELAHTGTILHSATSSDTRYNGVGIVGVLVHITDNDNNAPTVYAGPDQIVYMIGQSWTPSNLTPLVWYDADDASTITSNGTMVTTWRDKSGGNWHMQQTLNGNKPTTGLAKINGLNAISFDGSNDVMKTTANPFGSMITNASIYTVLNVRTHTDGTAFSLSGTPTSAQRWQSQIPASDGIIYFDCGGSVTGVTRVSYSPGWSTNVSKLMSYFGSPSQGLQEIWAGGSRIAKDTTGHSAVTAGGMALGSDGLTSYDNIWYGEVVVVKRILSTEDQQLLEGFLSHKWGLTGDLPAEHPYKTFNPNGAYGIATLDGTISDIDGDPLTAVWTLVSGPAPVSFVNSNALNTVVTFGVAGTYTFRLTASDGVTSAFDEVVINVQDGTDSDSDGMADSWEVSNFGGTGGSNGNGDQDGDGFIDLHEFLAGTSPTNSSSLLSLQSVSPIVGGAEVIVSWSGVAGKRYQLLSRTNLNQSAWVTNLMGIPGVSPTTTVTNGISDNTSYYLIKLE